MAPRRIAEWVASKALGIDFHPPSRLPPDLDKILGSAHVFLEQEPSVAGWFRELVPTRAGVVGYVRDLFPSASWIRRYNLRWLAGDMAAGVTVGLVVVPQALAYASLARLPPDYGLYTSFTGAILYWVFGTSKDVAIGTTAVGSLLVGEVVARVADMAPGKFQPEETAHALSILAGALLLFFGLFRLGWIVEFIPYVPISAFVTAASITIMCTQAPVVLGIPEINTRVAPYRVMVSTLRGLSNTRLDAAIGLSSIVMLCAIRSFCSMMEARRPGQKRLWTSISSLRLTFTMLLFTLISYLVNRNRPLNDAKFRIVGSIQRGFKQAGVPHPDLDLLKLVASELPAVVIVLVIEHIAIAKSMGRLSNYTINPSQEVVALGSANIMSPFIGGYVCTGSFGASAVLSKAGARSPLASLFSAVVLVLALYALTAVFYYIPRAALAGLIIHAVCTLMTPPKTLYKYWQISPVELLIWMAGIALAIFVSLEVSIYSGIGLSMVLLLFRLARTRGAFLGLVRVKRVGAGQDPSADGKGTRSPCRSIFLPLDRKDGSNADIKVDSPYPGVFLYRLREGYNYINQAYHVETLVRHVTYKTKRMSAGDVVKASDRLWNDAGPGAYTFESQGLPHLRAIVFDFSAVDSIDVTSVQGLVDLRNSLDRYASPDTVEWHFASIHNRWTRRALAAAGFGFSTWQDREAVGDWTPIYSIAATFTEKDRRRAAAAEGDEERTTGSRGSGDVDGDASGTQTAAVCGVDRPFFHMDLQDAVDAAVRDARRKEDTSWPEDARPGAEDAR